MKNISIDFLRNEWGSFFKWTVGLSLFLITASLTVLTFQKHISTFNKITAMTTAIALFGNVFLTWFFLGRTLFRIYVPMFNQSQGRPVQKEQFNRLVDNAKFYEQVIMTSFAVGFISFIVFLMEFILN